MKKHELVRWLTVAAKVLLTMSVFLAMVWWRASLVLFLAWWVVYAAGWWLAGGTGRSGGTAPGHA